MPMIGLLALVLWTIMYTAQVLLAFGTAYRKTKHGGDNGATLFGWLFIHSIAALVPGLEIAFWQASKKLDNSSAGTPNTGTAIKTKTPSSSTNFTNEKQVENDKGDDGLKVFAFFAIALLLFVIAYIATVASSPTGLARYR